MKGACVNGITLQSPYPDWQQKAWGASLLITAGVLVITLLARFTLREKKP